MDIIDKFVNRYKKRSINTVKNYRSQLKQYFDYLDINPNTYFNNNRDYQQDITRYWENKIIDRPPLVRSFILSCLKMFLMRNGVEFKSIFWSDLKEQAKGRKAISEDEVPTNEQLKKILLHANAMEKALFLIAASSGMRIGEILQLTWDDVKIGEKPVRIHILGEYTKSGDPRDTFITNETKEALLQWKNVRKEYLMGIDGKLNFKKVKAKYNRDPNDLRIFPITYVTASLRWNKLLEKARVIDKKTETGERKTKKGIDKKTNRIKMHIHCLRKFAKTRMLLTMPESICNYIVGHSGYLKRAYEKYEVVQLVPEYKKAIRNLLVFATSEVDVRIRQELAEIKKENEQLRKDMQSLMVRVLAQNDKE
jgi:integrase